MAGLTVPLQSSLDRVQERLHDLELARQEAYVGLTEQVKLLRETQELVRGETATLSRALRSPNSRGRWGELQLRRVVEMAGMVRHCDFVEQPNLADGHSSGRPDLVVSLPGGRKVVVDAKVPLAAYLDAQEASDEETRGMRLAQHARQLRGHVTDLGSRSYWSLVGESPEFVVAFLPGDFLLAAALEAEPDLIEHALAHQVLLATPTTLIALLRSVAYGWRQHAMADNAREVVALGSELHRRLATLVEHLRALGRGLDRSVEAYNRTVGSFEARVLVTARKLADLDADAPELATPVFVDARPRVSSIEEPDPIR